MKLILDKQTLILLVLGVTLMVLVLTCIIQVKMINEKNTIIKTYEQITEDFSEHCDMTFRVFVESERQKQLLQNLESEKMDQGLIILNES